MIFLLTDEASEFGDQREKVILNRKQRSGSVQTEGAQRQETGYSTDSMLPPEAQSGPTMSKRGGRRGGKRGRPPLPTSQGV